MIDMVMGVPSAAPIVIVTLRRRTRPCLSTHASAGAEIEPVFSVSCLNALLSWASFLKSMLKA